MLYDFFRTGTYDRNREFILTSSPSMDILISSNLERLIWLCAGGSDQQVRLFMDQLAQTGVYTLPEEMRGGLSDFCGYYADEEETAESIRNYYRHDGYVIDTHTAVAAHVYDQYRKETGDETPTVIASTASPYKFTRSVLAAIDPKYAGEDDFALIDRLHELSGVKIPRAVEEIRTAPVLHRTICEKSEMEKTVRKFLKICD